MLGDVIYQQLTYWNATQSMQNAGVIHVKPCAIEAIYCPVMNGWLCN